MSLCPKTTIIVLVYHASSPSTQYVIMSPLIGILRSPTLFTEYPMRRLGNCRNNSGIFRFVGGNENDWQVVVVYATSHTGVIYIDVNHITVSWAAWLDCEICLERANTIESETSKARLSIHDVRVMRVPSWFGLLTGQLSFPFRGWGKMPDTNHLLPLVWHHSPYNPVVSFLGCFLKRFSRCFWPEILLFCCVGPDCSESFNFHQNTKTDILYNDVTTTRRLAVVSLRGYNTG